MRWVFLGVMDKVNYNMRFGGEELERGNELWFTTLGYENYLFMEA